MVSKKKQNYFYDKLEVKLARGVVVGGSLSNAEIEIFLHDVIESITAELNRLSKEGVIDNLVERYAAGEKRINQLTGESERLYQEIFCCDAFPQLLRFRWMKTARSRIRDILKPQARLKCIAPLIVNNPELDNTDIAQLYYEEKMAGNIPDYLKTPRTHEVARFRRNLSKNNNVYWCEPKFSPWLALSRTDAHLCTVRRVKNQVLLSVGIESHRRSVIAFDIPDSPRYRDGKICKPDIMLDERGEVVLSFSFQHKAPDTYESVSTLGVDLGVLYPFTAAVITDEWRSQVIYPDDEIMSLVDKLEKLKNEKSALCNDIEENEREGRNARVRGIAERKRKTCDELAAAITKLKGRVADLVAHRICELAANARAEIAFEQLDWSCPSHAFFHSLIIENTENLALRLGIPVRKVSARGTSRNCPECGTELKQGRVMMPPTTAPARVPKPTDKCSKHAQAQKRRERAAARKAGKLPAPVPEKVKRGVKCPGCGHAGHHDAVSTYNIARRARGCDFPRRFVRLRFHRLSWSGLAPDLAADSVRKLTPVQDILLPSPSKTKAIEAWASQSGKSPLFARRHSSIGCSVR